VKFVDSRLFRISRSSRGLISLSVISALLITISTLAQAFLLSELITGAFQRDLDIDVLRPTLTVLIAVFSARILLVFLSERFTIRISHKIRIELRRSLFDKLLSNGSELNTHFGPARISLIATRGISNLEPYFTRFVPQLFIALFVPIIIGSTIAALDLISGLIVLFTLPLIPFFGYLIGRFTSDAMQKRWRTLGILSGYVLDLLSGLNTLRLFGRERHQAKKLSEVGEKYRVETMKVLRISFLTSLALEVIATLSVALIAVAIGLRLVDGDIELWRGLVILILAPEAYWPIRNLSAQFHASADGMQSARDIFEILDYPTKVHSGSLSIDSVREISWTDLVIDYPNRESVFLPAGRCRSGELNVVSGPSGSGKSSLINAILGVIRITSGKVTVHTEASSIPLQELNQDLWHRQISWIPQDPQFPSGTLRNVFHLSSPSAADEEINSVLEKVGLSNLALDQPVGLSIGQKRRLAIARALLHPHQILIMDEPSAALDPASEARIIEIFREHTNSGHLVIVITHRKSILELADSSYSLARVTS
jgi:ATP-binding cassette subfamily C protein CydCD